ncbi:MAG: hypothetical protein ACI8XC_004052 [Gammaproteobacteria bacterium]|jgi:hypothetical protein
MNFELVTKLTFTLTAFFRENVPQMGLRSFVAASRISFETLGRATVRLHFWHLLLQLYQSKNVSEISETLFPWAPETRLWELLNYFSVFSASVT